MTFFSKKFGFLILGIILFFPLQVWCQVSINVSSLDPVYRDIDKLVSHGLVDKIIVGQRPFSRREIARIIAEAMKNLHRLEDKINQGKYVEKRLEYVQQILDRLKNDYQEELVQLKAIEGESSPYSLHPLAKAHVTLLAADSPTYHLNDQSGLGVADVNINPLLQNQEGRHLVNGVNLSLETEHWLRLSNHFALAAQPRFQLAKGLGGESSDSGVFLQNAYAKIFFKNFEIEMGRDSLIYGQGLEGGLLLSNNPRPLDMVKISNDLPFYWPWVFKYLGPNKLSFFFANLGPEQNFPYAYLVGYKWSLQPVSFFEMGVSILTQSGGEGAPHASFFERVKDALPITHIFLGSQVEVGNKMGGLDMRFRIPPLRGTELYGEIILDDIHDFANPHALLVLDASYLGGVYIPRLDNSGKIDLRLEYHQTGTRMYRHGQFTSGWSLNRFLLGDTLGPDSRAIEGWLNADITDDDLLTAHGAWEFRRSDRYAGTTNPWNYIKTEELPHEKRYRFEAQWMHRFKKWPLQWVTGAGYEYVQNFGYNSGDNRNNFMGFTSLQIKNRH